MLRGRSCKLLEPFQGAGFASRGTHAAGGAGTHGQAHAAPVPKAAPARETLARADTTRGSGDANGEKRRGKFTSSLASSTVQSICPCTLTSTASLLLSGGSVPLHARRGISQGTNRTPWLSFFSERCTRSYKRIMIKIIRAKGL